MTATSRPRPVVLTIDDEAVVRTSFRAYLEDLDYTVVEAANGRLGIERIERDRPDVVLVDLRMPEVDGLDVLAYASEHVPHLPVIVVSGTGVIGDVVEALRLGAWDYLVKPVEDLTVLHHAVERALERVRLLRERETYQQRLEEKVTSRTAELERANAELRLAATTFDTQQPIFITDRSGVILRANRAFFRATGFASEEVLGKTPALFKSDLHDEAFYRRMWDELERDGRWQGEVWNRRKNGEVYPEWLTLTAVNDGSGTASHYVGACVDLTEIKRQEAQIRRAAAEEQALVELSRLSLKPLEMGVYLQEALDQLHTRVSWLNEVPAGGIFLANREEERDRLRLMAFHGRDPELLLHYGEAGAGDMEGDAAYIVEIGSGDEVMGRLVSIIPDGGGPTEDVARFLRRVADILSLGVLRRYAEAEIEYLAYYDALTGLPNRRLLLDRLDHELAMARRRGVYGALLFLDLDNFKTINDALGHPVGDALLGQAGGRLVGRVRAEDTVARLGGDEFVVLLPMLNSRNEQAAFEAGVVADDLRDALGAVYDLGGVEHKTSVSVGIALFPGDDESADDVLRHADTAMYSAKEGGRNMVRFYRPDMQAEADARLRLGKELRHALEHDEFELFYHPQVDAAGGVMGAEALIRWHHPERGLITPVDFIPVAEESGMILEIGEWVLGEACRQLAAWIDEGLGRNLAHMSVNVSPRQFRRPEFVQTVRRVLDRSGAPAERLILEITEGLLVENVREVTAKMHALKALGVGFAVDDFGTGYSSLSYLKTLPLDILKIDKSFVQDIVSDPNDAAIVDTIIVMSSRLALEVTAEGVETPEQLQFLETRGCQRYQGYLFAPPLPAEQFVAYCADNSIL